MTAALHFMVLLMVSVTAFNSLCTHLHTLQLPEEQYDPLPSMVSLVLAFLAVVTLIGYAIAM